ncbi:MAG TPA: hypothetical protein VM686_37715, partial [Polyangiaceae bacterium]|nr:hypothetical protein [Polyangiaceae bacterium]
MSPAYLPAGFAPVEAADGRRHHVPFGAPGPRSRLQVREKLPFDKGFFLPAKDRTARRALATETFRVQ